MANADEWQKLIIPAVGLESKRWLAEWRWLAPEFFSPLWLNCFGDWVFASRDGEIYFLDLLRVASKASLPPIKCSAANSTGRRTRTDG